MSRFNRPRFERLLKTRIQTLTTSVSTVSPPKSRNPPLSLVMEYKKVPIGCIFIQPVPTAEGESKSAQTTYRVAHFHVDAPYRHAGVGNDLFSSAVEKMEKTKGDIVGVTSRLTPYVTECLQNAGFVRDDGAVAIWDEGKRREPGYEEDQQGDVDSRRVALVDTRRTGWRLRRA